jgi:hypothetical protein
MTANQMDSLSVLTSGMRIHVLAEQPHVFDALDGDVIGERLEPGQGPPRLLSGVDFVDGNTGWRGHRWARGLVSRG